jgi:hypothetical protein
MTADETSELIAAAGGDSAFAKLLGIDEEPGVAQRVNNWKRRGMPPSVELEHYETIRSLKRRVSGQSAA